MVAINPKDSTLVRPGVTDVVTVYYIGMSSTRSEKPPIITLSTLGRTMTMPEIGGALQVPRSALEELKQKTTWADRKGTFHEGITENPDVARSVREAVQRGEGGEIDLGKALALGALPDIDTEALLEELQRRGGIPEEKPEAKLPKKSASLDKDKI